MLVSSLSFAGALDFHQARFADAGPRDALAPCRALRLVERRDLHGLPGLCRAVQRFDDTDILQALLTGRLRRAVLEDAIGEVQQLRRELVALADPLALRLAVHRQRVAKA